MTEVSGVDRQRQVDGSPRGVLETPAKTNLKLNLISFKIRRTDSSVLSFRKTREIDG